MATKIQVRRDTLSNWINNNPVLSAGEIGFVIDNNRMKVGDGALAFTLLPYLEADAYIDSVILGTDTTGNYVAQATASGAGISVTGSGESASVVISNTGVTSLTGTANEVEVSSSTGAVTLSLPTTINANTTGTAAALTNARTIALSGDVSGSASFDGSASAGINTTLANSGVSASTYGSATQIPRFTVDEKGRITSASVVVVEGLPNQSGNEGKYLTTNGSFSSWDTIDLGTDTQGNYVAQVSASGTGISVTGSGESASVVIENTGVKSLTGTANQISVSASTGNPTVSLPSAVTFPGTVTLNGNPNGPLEAATKQYVDAVAEGLHIHASCEVATTASVNLSSPTASVDGVALTNNMRVLVKNQSNTAENGIYVYNSSSAALVRASDFDSSAEIQGGDFVFVTGGDVYNNTGWVQTEKVTTLGTDPILFSQFSGAGTYSAGTGLQLDGTVFSNTGVLSLAGTANEVSVSASAGNVTISLPDDVALTGTPTSTTASVDTNTTQIATTAFVVGQGYLKSSTASSTYQPLDGDLTSIAGLTGTSGLLKKTAANTYTLDTTPTYPTGSGSNRLFYENDQIVTENYTINENKNVGSFGPITIATDVIVTIPSGCAWQIL
jgi:hypothetical protein